MQLHEQYRPKTWDLVVGQKGTLWRIGQIRQRGLAGRAYWISGPSGTGKTTIARLIAAEIASEWAIDEIDATDLSTARVRDLDRQSHCRGFGKGGRVYIVNEAHGLNKATVRQFLTTLERIPKHVVWIFTTTAAGQKLLFDGCIDASPLVSRCVKLETNTEDPVAFAARAREVAKAEGVDSQPLEAYVELVKSHDCNLRAVFQEIEAGAFVDSGGAAGEIVELLPADESEAVAVEIVSGWVEESE